MGHQSDADIARREPRRRAAESVVIRECPRCQQRVAVPVHRMFALCDRCRQAEAETR